MYLNKIQIIGNLTRDPELKALPSGAKVCSFSIATNRTWKDQNGKKQEQTEFHNIVFFGRVAEVIAQYCHKGSQLYVEGRLQTRTWEGNDGKKNYRTEVVGETMQFGNKPQGDGSRTTKRSEESQEPEPEDLGTIEYPDEDVNIDDIPF